MMQCTSDNYIGMAFSTVAIRAIIDIYLELSLNSGRSRDDS